MRHVSSCSVCRSRKKRCVPTNLNKGCAFCVSKKLVCDLKVMPHVSLARGLSQSRDQKSLSLLCSAPAKPLANFELDLAHDKNVLHHPICEDLLGLYFSMIHNKQQILFHHQTLLSEKKANLLPDYILLGIIALVARFSTDDYFRDTKPSERGSGYLLQALRIFNARSELVSLHSLQGCILLSFVCFVEGQGDQDSLLAAQAVRMVQLMKLPNLLTQDPIRRETELRLFWQAMMMDTWNSIRDRLPRQLIAKPSIPKPLDEEVFEQMIPGAPPSEELYTAQLRNSGIWGNVVDLSEKLAAVIEILTALIYKPFLDSEAEPKTHQMTLQLDHWIKNLASHLQNTRENLQRAARLGYGREFAVVHLIYHHQCQLLYFPYLSRSPIDNNEEAECVSEEAQEYISRCKFHAKSLSELMWVINTTPGMECLWSPVNGHLLVVASTIQLHSLLFDEDLQRTSQIKRLLEQNFVMLLQFQKYWPTLKHALSRLQVFHRNCISGHGLRAFQFDAWMLEFLTDYSTAIGERDAEPPHLKTATDPAPWEEDVNWYEITSENVVARSDLNALLSFMRC